MVVTNHGSKLCDDDLERRQICLEVHQDVGKHPELGAGEQSSDQRPRLGVRSIQDTQQLQTRARTDRHETSPQSFVDLTARPLHGDGVSLPVIAQTCDRPRPRVYDSVASARAASWAGSTPAAASARGTVPSRARRTPIKMCVGVS